jgi:endonuclease/exonuclease/phosphatase family metal-dependent hydrolase
LSWILLLGTFPLHGEEAPASAKLPTLRIASYNIANWGPTDRFVNGRRLEAAMKPESEQEAVVAILKTLDPDVLAVQEILQDPNDTWLHHLRDRIAGAGLRYPTLLTLQGEDPRIQTALFSKLPAAEHRAITEDSYEIGRRVQEAGKRQTIRERLRVGRGILHATFRTADQYEFEIFSVHLKSKRNAPDYDNPETREAGQEIMRIAEARILRQKIEERLAERPEANVVVLGDFNDAPNSRTLRTIVGTKKSKVHLFNLWLHDVLGDFWTHYYLPEKSYAKIDQILVSRGMWNEYDASRSFVYREKISGPQNQRWANASDHRPILATFFAKELTSRIRPEKSGAEEETGEDVSLPQP